MHIAEHRGEIMVIEMTKQEFFLRERAWQRRIAKLNYPGLYRRFWDRILYAVEDLWGGLFGYPEYGPSPERIERYIRRAIAHYNRT